MDIQVDAPKKVYTVSELTRHIRFTLENAFGSVWIEGEISNFTHHGSGHMYFSLKDAEASLQAAMFRQENGRLRFVPQDGLKVICRGRVSVWPPRGQYQLVVDAMEPKGLGALQAAFEQLKEKLGREGLFDAGRKKPIPFLPRRIGIITSLTGAVIRDMMHVFERRFPGAHLLVAPVQVQGEGAKHEIVRALRDFNEGDAADVLVLARGGGSLEDLWPFNEEIVARAIADSRIPVVSAVGHEVDTTIADFVADLRAPTPSAAAEMLLPDKKELLSRIEGLRRTLDRAALGCVEGLREELGSLLRSAGLAGPRRRLEETFQRLDEAARNLRNAVSHAVELAGEKLAALAGRLEALSPLGCLVRGYSITSREKAGAILKSVRGLAAGETIRTRLADGEIASRVEEIWSHPRAREGQSGFPRSRE